MNITVFGILRKDMGDGMDDVVGCCETSSSGHNIAVVLRGSQQLWLPMEDLHKTRPLTFQHGWRRGLLRPHTSLKSCGQFTVDERQPFSSLL